MKKVQDHYFKKAKQEGYPARSVYKLKEAQAARSFLKKGDTVLDLGAYPGSWSKYILEVIGPSGRLVAVDITPFRPLAENMIVIQRDITQLAPQDLLAIHPKFDSVVSDMAPKTTGHKALDHLRSVALAHKALELALAVGSEGCAFFCKVFQGSDFPAFLGEARAAFRTVNVVKPKSSRSESVEIFVYGTEIKLKG